MHGCWMSRTDTTDLIIPFPPRSPAGLFYNAHYHQLNLLVFLLHAVSGGGVLAANFSVLQYYGANYAFNPEWKLVAIVNQYVYACRLYMLASGSVMSINGNDLSSCD